MRWQYLILSLGICVFFFGQCTGLDPINFPCTTDAECRNLSCICGTCQPKDTPAACKGDGKRNESTTPTDGNTTEAQPDAKAPDMSSQGDQQPPDTTKPDPPPIDTALCKEGTRRSCYSGPPGTANVGICKNGQQQCKEGTWGPCIGEITPAKEICDSKDNNCNDKVDEELDCGCIERSQRTCYTGPEASKGRGVCKSGNQTCVNKKWSSCIGEVTPTTEVCDGKDNDCNGKVDEVPARDCSTGKQGICAKGRLACDQGINKCTQLQLPVPEICDGQDNDCDGRVDEEAKETECTVIGEKGECAQGTTSCKGGRVECVKQLKPTTEICDGKDNDCDGNIDEALECCKSGESRQCYSGPPSTRGRGRCLPGKQTCGSNRQWGTCIGEVLPASKEICGNNIDDDCDGNIDTNCQSQPKQYAYIHVDANGIQRSGRGITLLQRTKGSGIYTLSAVGYDCTRDGVPIFLTPQSTQIHVLTWECNASQYKIRTSKPITSAAPNVSAGDAGFYAVLPPKGGNEPWAVVRTQGCGMGATCAIAKTNTQAQMGVKRTSGVLFDITNTTCSKTGLQPFFASIKSSSLSGYTSTKVSPTSNKCQFLMYLFNGTPTTGWEIGLWLPEPARNAWGIFNGTTMQKSNSPTTPSIPWTNAYPGGGTNNVSYKGIGNVKAGLAIRHGNTFGYGAISNINQTIVTVRTTTNPNTFGTQMGLLLMLIQ